MHALEPTPDLEDRHLLCFGCGYVAKRLAAKVLTRGGRVSGTTRSESGAAALASLGITGHVFDGHPLPDNVFAGVTDVLCSIPPGPGGDDGVLSGHAAVLAGTPMLRWAALLSTTGVYGDTGGAWVDEDTPTHPMNERTKRRVEAEARWRDWGDRSGTPVQIFRLPGIYGPDRSAFARLRAGTAQRITKPGHVFNRIHVDDIVAALLLGMQKPDKGTLFNLADDEPSGADEVIAYAAGLLGQPEPPPVPFEEANLSPMGRQFYAESKRVSNERVKRVLGWVARFPTYREGLRATLAEETGVG